MSVDNENSPSVILVSIIAVTATVGGDILIFRKGC